MKKTWLSLMILASLSLSTLVRAEGGSGSIGGGGDLCASIGGVTEGLTDKGANSLEGMCRIGLGEVEFFSLFRATFGAAQVKKPQRAVEAFLANTNSQVDLTSWPQVKQYCEQQGGIVKLLIKSSTRAPYGLCEFGGEGYSEIEAYTLAAGPNHPGYEELGRVLRRLKNRFSLPVARLSDEVSGKIMAALTLLKFPNTLGSFFIRKVECDAATQSCTFDLGTNQPPSRTVSGPDGKFLIDLLKDLGRSSSSRFEIYDLSCDPTYKNGVLHPNCSGTSRPYEF